MVVPLVIVRLSVTTRAGTVPSLGPSGSRPVGEHLEQNVVDRAGVLHRTQMPSSGICRATACGIISSIAF